MEVYSPIVKEALYKFSTQDSDYIGKIYYFDIEYWNPMGNMSIEMPEKASGNLVSLLHVGVDGELKRKVNFLDGGDLPEDVKQKFVDYVFSEFIKDYKEMKP